MLLASHIGMKTAARRLRPKQKAHSMLRKLSVCFSQPGNRVVDLSEGIFSAAVVSFTVPRHWLLEC